MHKLMYFHGHWVEFVWELSFATIVHSKFPESMSIKSPRLPSPWRSWLGVTAVELTPKCIYGDMEFQIIHFREVGLSSMSNESMPNQANLKDLQWTTSWNLKVDFRILDSSFQSICQVMELPYTKEMGPGCWTRPHIAIQFWHRWRRMQISWYYDQSDSMTICLNMLIHVAPSYNLYIGVACGAISKASWIGYVMFTLPCWFDWDQMAMIILWPPPKCPSRALSLLKVGCRLTITWQARVAFPEDPLEHLLHIAWVVPLPSNSHHQDCYVFSRGSYKPSFATATGRGDNPTYCKNNI